MAVATAVAMEAMGAMVATVEAMVATAMARGPLMLSPRLRLRPTGATDMVATVVAMEAMVATAVAMEAMAATDAATEAMAATAMARGPLMPSPDMAMVATDAATEAMVATVVAMEVMVAMA